MQRVGRYQLHHEIASGGMATVYAGRLQGPAGFARTVAIKRLHPQFAKQPEFCAMFMDEARIASRLVHPNVVHTLDVVADEGELFLVMEYVPGQSLAWLVAATRAQGEPVPLPIAIAIAVGALQGLHAAHEARSDSGKPLQVVHRDVSPQNVLVGVDGVARLLDFGVAKAIDRLQTTRDGSIKGKFAYMSPEQIEARDVDRRTDVYAAGVVLWELLTGQRLRAAESAGAVVNAVLRGAVPLPSSLRQEVPAALDAIVIRALRTDRDERFETALALAEALEAVVAPAGAREVAAWVGRLARSELRVAAERVVSMESPSVVTAKAPAPLADLAPPPSSAVATHPPAELLAVAAPVARAADAPRSARRRTVLVAGGIGVLLAGAVLTLRMRSAPEEASAALPMKVPASEPVGAGTNAAAVSAEPAASVPASSSSSVSSSTPEPAPVSTAAVTRTPSPTRAAPRGAASSARCNPPHYLDAEGIKRYKPGCLR